MMDVFEWVALFYCDCGTHGLLLNLFYIRSCFLFKTVLRKLFPQLNTEFENNNIEMG